MTRELQDVLEAAALNAFEQLGFLLVDPEPPVDAGALDGMRVRFRGPTEGAIVVRGDRTLLQALSMSMLGCDEPPAPALQLDALGEIANVICGNVVPADDPSAVFRLEAPSPAEPEPGSGETLRAAVELGFEGGWTRIEWLEGPA